MKNLLIIFSLLTVSCGNAQQNEIPIDSVTMVIDSNVTESIEVEVKPRVYNLDVKKPKSKEQVIGKAKKTKDTAIYKGIEYPVYQTAKGRLFIVYLDSKRNYSKKYITE